MTERWFPVCGTRRATGGAETVQLQGGPHATLLWPREKFGSPRACGVADGMVVEWSLPVWAAYFADAGVAYSA
jgi:hypothetical protein